MVLDYQQKTDKKIKKHSKTKLQSQDPNTDILIA